MVLIFPQLIGFAYLFAYGKNRKTQDLNKLQTTFQPAKPFSVHVIDCQRGRITKMVSPC